MKLTRYWFIVYPSDRFGPRNFGVTAFSKEQAKGMIIEEMTRLHLLQRIEGLNNDTEVIENIDIGLLDQGHVIPNIGVVTFKGVWFPRLNMI